MADARIAAELTRRADLLSSLLKHPGWVMLEEETERKIEKMKATAGNVSLNAANQQEAWEKMLMLRGSIAALNWYKGVPRHAERTLRRFLEQQGFEDDEIEGDE